MLGLSQTKKQANKGSIALVTFAFLSVLCVCQAPLISANEIRSQDTQTLQSEETPAQPHTPKAEEQVTSVTVISHTAIDSNHDHNHGMDSYPERGAIVATSTQIRKGTQEKILSTYQPQPVEERNQEASPSEKASLGQDISYQGSSPTTPKPTQHSSMGKGERLSSTYQPKPYQAAPISSSKPTTTPNPGTPSTAKSSDKSKPAQVAPSTANSQSSSSKPTTVAPINPSTAQPATNKPTGKANPGTPTASAPNKNPLNKPATPSTPPDTKIITPPKQANVSKGVTAPTQTGGQTPDRTEAIWAKNNKLIQKTYATPHWASKEATVFINAKHPEIIAAYKEAITSWNKTGAFYFHLTQDKSKANIIADERYQANVASPLGITYSTYYMPNQQYSQANVYLNRFHVENKYYQKNGGKLLHTAQHELGHAIGLDHNSAVASVMEPTGGKTSIQAVDINNVKKLYQIL